VGSRKPGVRSHATSMQHITFLLAVGQGKAGPHKALRSNRIGLKPAVPDQT
jgi:hypothetical protein